MKLTGAAAVLALCASPATVAAATTTAIQPIRPLVVVSVFGTQASAQIICSQGVSGATAVGAAAAAQGQAGCVLPATDVPPRVGEVPASPPPPSGGGLGVGWILAGLDALLVLAGISTLFDDDDDDGDSPT